MTPKVVIWTLRVRVYTHTHTQRCTDPGEITMALRLGWTHLVYGTEQWREEVGVIG